MPIKYVDKFESGSEYLYIKDSFRPFIINVEDNTRAGTAINNAIAEGTQNGYKSFFLVSKDELLYVDTPISLASDINIDFNNNILKTVNSGNVGINPIRVLNLFELSNVIINNLKIEGLYNEITTVSDTKDIYNNMIYIENCTNVRFLHTDISKFDSNVFYSEDRVDNSYSGTGTERWCCIVALYSDKVVFDDISISNSSKEGITLSYCTNSTINKLDMMNCDRSWTPISLFNCDRIEITNSKIKKTITGSVINFFTSNSIIDNCYIESTHEDSTGLDIGHEIDEAQNYTNNVVSNSVLKCLISSLKSSEKQLSNDIAFIGNNIINPTASKYLIKTPNGLVKFISNTLTSENSWCFHLANFSSLNLHIDNNIITATNVLRTALRENDNIKVYTNGNRCTASSFIYLGDYANVTDASRLSLTANNDIISGVLMDGALAQVYDLSQEVHNLSFNGCSSVGTPTGRMPMTLRLSNNLFTNRINLPRATTLIMYGNVFTNASLASMVNLNGGTNSILEGVISNNTVRGTLTDVVNGSSGFTDNTKKNNNA